MAIDTNVLVRLLVSDNPIQSKASHKLFATEDIFIPDTVLLETEWVLRAAFDLTPADICTAFRRDLRPAQRHGERRARSLPRSLPGTRLGFDFADAFHLALKQGTGRAQDLRRRTSSRIPRSTPNDA
jgi:predicted nucleic acid-binding protein